MEPTTNTYLQAIAMAVLALASDTHRVVFDEEGTPSLEIRPPEEPKPELLRTKPPEALRAQGKVVAWEHETPATVNGSPITLLCIPNKERTVGFDVTAQFHDEKGVKVSIPLFSSEELAKSP